MRFITKTFLMMALVAVLAGGILATAAPQKAYAGPAGSLTQTFAVEADCKEKVLDAGNCGIIRYLLLFINVLSGLVGVVVVMMIIIGGIQYASAGDYPQKITAAKGKITNALLALFTFIFMFAFLQWVVPGGIF